MTANRSFEGKDRHGITRETQGVHSQGAERPARIADLSDAWQPSKRGDLVDWTRLRAFVDYLALRPQDAPEALREQPAPSGSALLDGILAGIAETESAMRGLRPPAWTKFVPALPEPWESPGTPTMRQASAAATPPAMAARGITLAATSIWRATATPTPTRT